MSCRCTHQLFYHTAWGNCLIEGCGCQEYEDKQPLRCAWCSRKFSYEHGWHAGFDYYCSMRCASLSRHPDKRTVIRDYSTSRYV
jgi:hypothetical protein